MSDSDTTADLPPALAELGGLNTTPAPATPPPAPRPTTPTTHAPAALPTGNGLTAADHDAIAANVAAKMQAWMSRTMTVQPADGGPAPRKENAPTANLGRAVVIWTAASDEPMPGLITREYLDDAHPGYVDLIAFPSGQAPMPIMSAAPIGTLSPSGYALPAYYAMA